MDKKEAEDMRWSGYQMDVPIDETLFEEALEILDNTEKRRSQNNLVNWKERAEMNEASQRNKGFLEKAVFVDPEVSEMQVADTDKLKELNEEEAIKVSAGDGQEVDLVAYGVDLIGYMEENDV